jgi:hypothetical protein
VGTADGLRRFRPDNQLTYVVHATKLKLAMLMEKVIDVQTRVAPVPYSLVAQIDAEFKQCTSTSATSLSTP